MMMACDRIEALRVEKRADNTTDPKAPTTICTPFLQNPSFGNYMALCAARKPAALADAVREVAGGWETISAFEKSGRWRT
jgi:hypothetical protein